MTERFNKFLPFILEWETVFGKGHYGDDKYVLVEHDPDDPGGTTKYGIDKGAHPHEDIEHLTKNRAIQIYWDEWNEDKAEGFAAGLGEVFFNACVNCGIGRARKLLAEAAGNAAGFLNAQIGFYKRLAAARPKSQKYLKGWMNRVDALAKWVGVKVDAT